MARGPMWHNVIFWKIHAFSRGDTMQASRQGCQFTGNSQIQNTLAPLGIPWVSVNKGFVCNDHVLTTAPDRVFVCIAKIIVFVQSPPIVTAAKIKHLYAFDYTNVRPRLAVRNVFSLEAGPDLCP
jgi:hypothetical protein